MCGDIMSKTKKLSKVKKLANRRRCHEFTDNKREEALKKLTELDQELKLYSEDLHDT